jgi:hypothetical protein
MVEADQSGVLIRREACDYPGVFIRLSSGTGHPRIAVPVLVDLSWRVGPTIQWP